MTHIKNDTQLAYYVQGFFEITGTTDLNEKQAKQILGHIVGMDQKGKVATMITSELVVDNMLTLTNNLNRAGMVIAAQLNEIFHHDIDPSYTGDQQEFQTAHDGNLFDDGPQKPVMRC